jgi:hypothetical protein
LLLLISHIFYLNFTPPVKVGAGWPRLRNHWLPELLIGALRGVIARLVLSEAKEPDEAISTFFPMAITPKPRHPELVSGSLFLCRCYCEACPERSEGTRRSNLNLF